MMMLRQPLNYTFYIALLTFLLPDIAHALTEKYRCIIREEPATSMVIGWNQASGESPVVYYDTEDHGTDVSKYAYKVYPQRTIKAKGMNNHYARLAELMPETKYYFVIQDNEGTSARYWFETLPDDHNTQLSIIGGGDSRNHRLGRQNANKTVAKIRPHMVLFSGDMTGGDTEREWRQWMEDWQLTIAADGRMTPIVPARGNHEFSNQSIVDMFDVKNPDVYYALTFARGLIRVYTLNSMMPASGDQRQWLGEDLQNHQNTAWRMAQYHHPMRPHTKRKSEHEYLRRYWAPLFYQYGVQLALECDSHVAKVTWPIRTATREEGAIEGFVRDDEKGTVFVGEGGWGAPLREADDAKKWTQGIGSFNQVNWFFITLNKMEVRKIRTDNVDKMEALTDNRRFEIPANIDLWYFNKEGVLTMENKGLASFVPAEKQSLMNILEAAANPVDEFVKIEWNTVHEEEHVRYRIESSNTKLFWKTLTTIQGKGINDDTPHFYEFTDKSVNRGGKIYYRVVAVDVLGKERVKKSIEIRALGNEKLESIMASAQSGQLSVYVLMPYDERVTIELFDTRRNLVFRRSLDVPKGDNRIPLNIKYLIEGHYLLELSYRNRLFKRGVHVKPPEPHEN